MADPRVIPMFSYEDVGRAADWIATAFGYPSPDYQAPKHHAEVCEQAHTWRQTPYVVDGVHVSVDDIDAHYAQARAAGATILSELEDNTGIGQRQYRAEDLEGHRWMFAQLL
jgi:predicted enzyme related to lactoylglutathione lyase